MERKKRLATILAYMTLEMGALLGVPIRLDEIEEMTRLLTRTAVVQVEREDAGGDPPTGGGSED